MLDILYANEKPGEMPPSYYAATADLLDPFPALHGDQTSDVCIVGAGFTGLSAALHLRRSGYSVTLLDAHRVGWGASGRNGGQVGSGQRVDQQTLAERVGKEDAKRLWSIAEDAKALVAKLISDLNIDCHYQPGVMEVNHKRRFSAETKEYVAFLQDVIGYDKVSYVPENELSELLGTDVYYDGYLDTGAGHLHPLRFALALARACSEEGVAIYEQTRATEIRDGKKVCVRTENGSIHCDYLILAGNGYLGNLDRRTKGRVMPINNFVIATEPLAEDVATSLIANNAAVADSRYVINYYRLSKDRRMLFGGRESYSYRFPNDISSYVRAAMLKVYPQLSNTRIDFAWGGVVGITMSRMPHFEWLSPRSITLGGYSGHGVALATMGGKLAAEAIGGVAAGFSLMEATPTPAFPGRGRLRLPLLALGMAYYSLLDRL